MRGGGLGARHGECCQDCTKDGYVSRFNAHRNSGGGGGDAFEDEITANRDAAECLSKPNTCAVVRAGPKSCLKIAFFVLKSHLSNRGRRANVWCKAVTRKQPDRARGVARTDISEAPY